jgi:hypothetical protein
MVTVIRCGTVLQGDGGASTGAEVLQFKPSSLDENCTVILCKAPNSPHHPFVVWTYNEITGGCGTGDYFETVTEAAQRFEERKW